LEDCTILLSKVWDYDSAKEHICSLSKLPESSTDVRRRAYMRKLDYVPPCIYDLIDQYAEWENDNVPDMWRPSKIEPTTLQGYLSHVRKLVFFSYATLYDPNEHKRVAESPDELCSSDSDGETDGIDMDSVTSLAIGVKTIKELFNLTFVLERHNSNTPPSVDTLRNYCWAFKRFLSFVKAKSLSKHSYFSRIKVKQVDFSIEWVTKTAAHNQRKSRANAAFRNSLDFLRNHNMWLEGPELMGEYEYLEKLWVDTLSQVKDDNYVPIEEVALELQIFVMLTILLLEVPLRTQNISNLVIGENLVLLDTQGLYQVNYQKFKSNGEQLTPYSPILSEESSDIINDFINYVRPLLCPTTNDLFINTCKKNKMGKVGSKIARFFYNRTGVTGIYPSRIRSIVASSARNFPQDQRNQLSKGMLHSPDTHNRYYAKSSRQEDHVMGRTINRKITDSWRSSQKPLVRQPHSSSDSSEQSDDAEMLEILNEMLVEASANSSEYSQENDDCNNNMHVEDLPVTQNLPISYESDSESGSKSDDVIITAVKTKGQMRMAYTKPKLTGKRSFNSNSTPPLEPSLNNNNTNVKIMESNENSEDNDVGFIDFLGIKDIKQPGKDPLKIERAVFTLPNPIVRINGSLLRTGHVVVLVSSKNEDNSLDVLDPPILIADVIKVTNTQDILVNVLFYIGHYEWTTYGSSTTTVSVNEIYSFGIGDWTDRSVINRPTRWEWYRDSREDFHFMHCPCTACKKAFL